MDNEPIMSIENPTLAHFRHFSSLFTKLPSTTVEDSLQITPFLTNKANFRKSQMNVSPVITREYENNSNWTLGENKPNSKPIKANLPDDQMNVTTFLTKDYENISNWTLDENKANTNPIQTQTKPISKAKKMLMRLTINGRHNYNGRSLAEKAGNGINSISPAGLLYFPGKSL